MAFHPYPQLIPSVFNLSGFAPPQSLTSASHWPWVDHPASGPEHATHTLIRIRFRYGSPHSWLTTQHATDSQAHSSKGTPPPHPQGGAMTDYQHMVSGTLSLPSRGTFHRSLTVLLRYRSPGGIQAAGWSQQIHTGFHVPRATRAPYQRGRGSSAYGALTLHGPPSQGVRLPPRFLTTPPPRQEQDGTTPQPRRGRPCRVTSTTTVSAIIRFRSPLLTEYPLLRVLRCFTSPRNPHTPYTFRRG